jgi:prephenate dehydrogenase
MPRLGIIGTGLIGASIGLAARAGGYEVLGYDRDPEAAAAAQRTGAIDRVADREELYASCEIVAIAAHIGATLEEVAQLHARPLGSTLVIDVASVKAPVARAARGVAAFVPTHPMAGSERRGPTAARGDLFEGRTWCYVPTADAARTARASVFIASLGATPVAVGAEEHDRTVALTSHLPQFLAYALTRCIEARAQEAPDLVDALCGPAAREFLRLGRSTPQMWDEIFSANGEALARELNRFLEVLEADPRVSR